MNNLIKSDFIPMVAIIAYSQGDEREYYLESRKIQQKENGFHLLEGSPLTKELLAGMVEEIDVKKLEKISCQGFLPKNLLSFSNDNSQANMIWYVEGSERNLVFKEGLSIKDGTMNVPTLVFKLKGATLSVFATKTNNVNEETKLYRAPFYNIYDGGNICMGSANIRKSKNVSQLMKNAEDAFFQSKFTELHGQSPIKGNLNTFIKKQMKGNKPFDKGVLLSINKQVEDLL